MTSAIRPIFMRGERRLSANVASMLIADMAGLLAQKTRPPVRIYHFKRKLFYTLLND